MSEKKQSNTGKRPLGALFLLTCSPLVLLVAISSLVIDSISELLVLSLAGLAIALLLVPVLVKMSPLITKWTGKPPLKLSHDGSGNTEFSGDNNIPEDRHEVNMLLLSEHAGFGIFVLQNGCIKEVGPNLPKIFGASLETLSSWSINDLIKRIHDDDVKFAVVNPEEEEEARIRLNKKCWFRFAVAKDKIIWLQFLVKSIKYDDDDAFFVTVMDITELKEFEQKISEQKLFLEQIMNSFSQPFFVVDANSHEILIENSAARQRKSDQQVEYCQALNPGCSTCKDEGDICPVEIVKRTKLPAMVERKYIDDQGSLQYIEIRAYPILDRNNNVISVLEHQQDVTFERWRDRSLMESEERYADLFQKSQSVMLMLDPEDGNIFDANPSACQFFGYEHSKLVSLNISDISLSSGDEERHILSLSLKNRQTQLYTRYKLSSGEVRNVEVYLSAIRMSGREFLFCIIHDISVRWKIEQKLKQRYDYETLAATISTRFINLQSDEIDGGIKKAMKEIGRFTGVEHCFIVLFDVTQDTYEITHQWNSEGKESLANRFPEAELSRLPKTLTQPDVADTINFNSIEAFINDHQDERSFWQHVEMKSMLATPLISSGIIKGWYGIAMSSIERTWSENDLLLFRISAEMFIGALERKHFEEQLRESRDQLQELSAHIQDRIEGERATIAREVHDELGQLLTALKFDVSLLKNKLPVENIQLQEKGRTMMEIVDEAIKSVQKITAELRPVMLDDLGLAPAIEWLSREFSERTGIECILGLDEVEVEGPVAISLFRITQEALTNIARHAFATELELSLKASEDGISLIISDNGVGIVESQLTDNKSYGLMGLRERATFLNGRINITGERGKGTIIDVWIPTTGRGDHDSNSRS